jgi:3-hydroxyisobutyrate dehydrogenase-like beta-hydroxyacid dehydrogenase
MCEMCSVIVSVCPPHAAQDVAEQVIAGGFQGLYVDVNAISPQRALSIGAALARAGITFVDGGIIGGPAWDDGKTWLYLSGDHAAEAAAYFGPGSLETAVLDGDIGRASALKMCYAAWTKGSTALLSAIVAAASRLGVWEELQRQWEQDWPGFGEETANRVRRVSARAWRFAGEMDEIARTLESAGLPGGFHAASAQVYRRMAHLKEAPSTPELDEVLAALTHAGGAGESKT